MNFQLSTSVNPLVSSQLRKGSLTSLICSNTRCAAPEPCEATKMCLDHSIPLTQRSDLPPPAFFCSDCADKFSLGRPRTEQPVFEDINLPILHVDLACGNKNCRSQDKIGVCICFSPECTIYNSHRPIRSAASRRWISLK